MDQSYSRYISDVKKTDFGDGLNMDERVEFQDFQFEQVDGLGCVVTGKRSRALSLRQAHLRALYPFLDCTASKTKGLK